MLQPHVVLVEKLYNDNNGEQVKNIFQNTLITVSVCFRLGLYVIAMVSFT